MVEKLVTEVEPGSILAADVTDAKARLLFPQGATLTEAAIRALTQRGIERVTVAAMHFARDQALLGKARLLAEQYFSDQEGGHPFYELLFDLRTEAEAQRLEMGRPPIFLALEKPTAEVLTPQSLPSFSLADYTPPELPALAYEINKTLSDPEVSAGKVAEVTSRSPSLTVKLLRLVNSPIYGVQGKIETISRAISIIGMRDLCMLASALVMVEHFGVIPRSVTDMRGFLEHTLGCALTARALAEAIGSAESETAFVAGLLHDIGKLYFFTAFPERSKFCIESNLQSGRGLMFEERLYFGSDHASVGQRLLESWHMPLSLQQAVAHHHSPALAKDPFLSSIVYVADAMAHAMGYASSGEYSAPVARPGILEMLKLRPAQLAEISVNVSNNLEPVVAAFM